MCHAFIMIGTRKQSMSHIYFDENIDKYSNVGLGLVIRALGAKMKVCYVDIQKNSYILNQFFLNLNYENFFYFNFEDLIFSQLNDFNVIIFDNCIFEIFDKEQILNILKNKPENLEIIFTFSNRDQFNSIKESFDLISEYKYVKDSFSDFGIFNITGNGKGKSTYLFGMLLRFLIEKNRVCQLIYFDKGGNFYSERFFFDKLKSELFDLKISGTQRFDGIKFRFENLEQDFKEAKKGLQLFIDSKSEVIFLDELNTTIKTGLLKKEEIFDALEEKEGLIVLSGRYSCDEIIEISDVLVEVIECKHYVYQGFGVRKGIDF